MYLTWLKHLSDELYIYPQILQSQWVCDPVSKPLKKKKIIYNKKHHFVKGIIFVKGLWLSLLLCSCSMPLENSYFGHHCFSASLKAESHVKGQDKKNCLESIQKVFFRLRFLLKMLFPFWQQFSSYFDQQPGFPAGVAMLAIVSEHLILSVTVKEFFFFFLISLNSHISESRKSFSSAWSCDWWQHKNADVKQLSEIFLKVVTHSSVNPT